VNENLPKFDGMIGGTHLEHVPGLIEQIGVFHADEKGELRCPVCFKPLVWYASFRVLYLDCKMPKCVHARAYGVFKKAGPRTPQYGQESLF
jgi:hypothetical protein